MTGSPTAPPSSRSAAPPGRATRLWRLAREAVLLGLRIGSAVTIGLAIHAEDLIGLATGILAFALLQEHQHLRDRSDLGSPPPTDLEVGPAGYRTPRLDRAQVALIATALTDPRELITRIKEYVVPLTRARDARCDYWLSFRVPAAAEQVWFPILTLDKGELQDHFRVRLADGTELPTTTFEESVGLVIACIDKFAAQAEASVYERYTTSVRPELILAIAGRGKVVDDARYARLLGMLAGVLGPGPNAAVVEVLAARLIPRYALFARVPVGPPTGTEGLKEVRLVLTTTTRSVHYRRVTGRRGHVYRFLRDLVGVRENTFEHSLEQAARTPSYHLEFLGPDGTYLAVQETRPDPLPVPWYRHLTWRGRLGQRYAHLYVRGAAEDIGKAVARFTFHERPPGSIGTATIAALGSLIGIYAASRVALGRPETGGSDAVALLIALPGLASGLLEFGRPAGMIGGVLAARLAATMTFGLSCAAILLFFVTRIPAWLRPPAWLLALLPDRIGHLLADRLTYENLWELVLIASAVTWMMSASSWLRRSRLHNHILTADVDLDDPTHQPRPE